MRLDFAEVIRIFYSHRRMIVATTLATTMLAVVYVTMLKRDMWGASQGVLIRDEAVGELNRLGRFESTDAMQTVQETLLEIAVSAPVIKNTLKEIGPAKEPKTFFGFGSGKKDAFPSDKQIEDFQGSIKVFAPGGCCVRTHGNHLCTDQIQRPGAIAQIGRLIGG